jgi:hypothetical protein
LEVLIKTPQFESGMRLLVVQYYVIVNIDNIHLTIVSFRGILKIMKELKTKEKIVSKKEIRTKIQNSVNLIVGELKIAAPSRKVKKEIQRASKKIANEINVDLKKVAKKTSKAKIKPSKGLNGKKIVAAATA